METQKPQCTMGIFCGHCFYITTFHFIDVSIFKSFSLQLWYIKKSLWLSPIWQLFTPIQSFVAKAKLMKLEYGSESTKKEDSQKVM